jgi:hypothetical protein
MLLEHRGLHNDGVHSLALPLRLSFIAIFLFRTLRTTLRFFLKVWLVADPMFLLEMENPGMVEYLLEWQTVGWLWY